MKSYFKFVNLADKTALIFCLFILCLLWAKFFVRNLFVALAVAGCICFVLTILIVGIIDLKANNKLITIKQQEKIQKLKDFFYYNNISRVQSFFIANYKAQILSNNTLAIKNSIYYLLLDNKNITDKDVIKLIKQNSGVRIFNIICIDVDDTAKRLSESFIDIQVIYIDAKKLVIDYDVEAEKEQNLIEFKKRNKLSFKEFMLLFVKESNFKGYIFSGCILMFSSLIIRQNLYYYVIASILILLAFVCKLLPKLKKVKKC